MGVCIRLKRLGSKQKPYYRLVASDRQSTTQGQALESLGVFDPLAKGKTVKIDTERVSRLRQSGATLSPSVARLLKRAADLQKA